MNAADLSRRTDPRSDRTRSTATSARPAIGATVLGGLILCGSLLAGAASAQDIAIDSVTISNPPKAGNCNTVTVTIRNTSNQLINVITGAKVITFPSATPNQNRAEKATFFSALQPNGTMTRTVQGVELLGGQVQHTVQVVADFENKVQETNENNNLDTQFVNPSQTCGGGLCDLKAESISPTYSNLPGTYPAKISVKFRNVGGANCQSSTLQLSRYEGTSASGSATVVGNQTLSSASPNQLRSVGWSDNDHPSSGTFTYAYSWVGNPPDSDTSNNFLTKTVTFTSPGGGNQGGGNPAGCDLSAVFIAPGNTVSGGSNSSFQVRFKNQGTATCQGAKISLPHSTGSKCSAYGSKVGGSGNFQALNPLSSGQEQVLTWSERRGPRKGTYCHKMTYSPAFNDSNNNNHHPQKTVSYQ